VISARPRGVAGTCRSFRLKALRASCEDACRNPSLQVTRCSAHQSELVNLLNFVACQDDLSVVLLTLMTQTIDRTQLTYRNLDVRQNFGVLRGNRFANRTRASPASGKVTLETSHGPVWRARAVDFDP
jgi:hypothetical protein